MRVDRWVRRAGLWLAAGCFSAQAATVVVVNTDAPGVGFNDPTPVAPVGGNPGTTLGDQRLNVFNFVAKYWGDRLQSDVPISILATFQPLSCSPTSGILGAAGPITVWADFPGAALPGTWYPSALANKLAKSDLYPGPDPYGADRDIIAFFNGNLGQAGCLDGVRFYLGLDGHAGKDIDLLTTVLHEVAHGLGFATYTDGMTGERLGPPSHPSVWDHFLYDPTLRKTWRDMSPAELRQSAVTPRNLVWNGPAVRQATRSVLTRGTPELFVFGPHLNRFVMIGTATFGPPLSEDALAAPMAHVVDQPDGQGLACTPLEPVAAAKVKGKVALVDRGGCAFDVKTRILQNAGASAVIVVDNVPGSPPPELAGQWPCARIPTVRVTRDDGARLKAAVDASHRAFTPIAVLFVNDLKPAGADYAGRPYLYTPDPFSAGSSVSHYDTSAGRHLLMEPFSAADQPIAVSAPDDLTLELLHDLGW